METGKGGRSAAEIIRQISRLKMKDSANGGMLRNHMMA